MYKEAVIFDMDGVLIDSEPFWRQAQISALAAYGASATVDDCIRLTMGKRLDDIAAIWCQHFSLTVEPERLKQQIMQTVVGLIQAQGQPKEGLVDLLVTLRDAGLRIGLATSSSYPVIDAVLDRFAIRAFFSVICSGDDERYGKPHPAVYLTAAEKLGVAPAQCMVIEDSVTGMVAGLAAAMTTYVVPEDMDDPRFSIAQGRFSSLTALKIVLLQAQAPAAL